MCAHPSFGTWIGRIGTRSCITCCQLWDPLTEEQIAVVYLIVGGIGLLVYIFSSVFVYIGEKDFERSVVSTRVGTFEMESAIGLATSSAYAEADIGQQVSGNAENAVQSARARGLHEGNIGNNSRRGAGKSKRQLLI
jgi:hypothetical protein